MPLPPAVPEWRVVHVVAEVVVLGGSLSAQRQRAPPPRYRHLFLAQVCPRTQEKPTSFTI
eukprot:8214558-Pyramimonas_sp.AAC.1